MAQKHRTGQENELSQLGATVEGRRSLGSLGGLGMKQAPCAAGEPVRKPKVSVL